MSTPTFLHFHVLKQGYYTCFPLQRRCSKCRRKGFHFTRFVRWTEPKTGAPGMFRVFADCPDCFNGMGSNHVRIEIEGPTPDVQYRRLTDAEYDNMYGRYRAGFTKGAKEAWGWANAKAWVEDFMTDDNGIGPNSMDDSEPWYEMSFSDLKEVFIDKHAHEMRPSSKQFRLGDDEIVGIDEAFQRVCDAFVKKHHRGFTTNNAALIAINSHHNVYNVVDELCFTDAKFISLDDSIREGLIAEIKKELSKAMVKIITTAFNSRYPTDDNEPLLGDE